jgi:hypothetical protein
MKILSVTRNIKRAKTPARTDSVRSKGLAKWEAIARSYPQPCLWRRPDDDARAINSDSDGSGLLPAPPRWLSDHADPIVKSVRASAQQHALVALFPHLHPLACIDDDHSGLDSSSSSSSWSSPSLMSLI